MLSAASTIIEEYYLGNGRYTVDEECITRVFRAMDSLRTDSPWEPIDTAPKDGTRVFLYVPAYRSPVVVGYYRVHVESDYGVETRRVEEWSDLGMSLSGPPNPSHWMPIPDIPA